MVQHPIGPDVRVDEARYQQRPKCGTHDKRGHYPRPLARFPGLDGNRVVVLGGNLLRGLVTDFVIPCVSRGHHRAIAEHIDLSRYSIAAPKQAFQSAGLEDSGAFATYSIQPAVDVHDALPGVQWPEYPTGGNSLIQLTYFRLLQPLSEFGLAYQNELQHGPAVALTVIRQQPQLLQHVIAQNLGLIDDDRNPFLRAVKLKQMVQRLYVLQIGRSEGGVKIELSHDYPHYLQERELGVVDVRDPGPLVIALQQGIYERGFSAPGFAGQHRQAAQIPLQPRFERGEALKMSWAEIDCAAR